MKNHFKFKYIFLFPLFTLFSQKIVQINSALFPNKEHPLNKEISSSIETLELFKKEVNKILPKGNKDSILAIGFPEILRYNFFKDYVETEANRVLYVAKGKEYADYSIGLFQMKPSFIETLELEQKDYDALKKYKFIKCSNLKKDISKEREIRINRLNNIQWQLVYLNVFWDLMNEKYRDKKFNTSSEKIQFIATVYNCGINKPEIVYRNNLNRKIFPYGKNHIGEQASFGEISNQYLQRIFLTKQL